MTLTGFRESSVEPFASGTQWGRFGGYEAVCGIADFAVDPAHPANAGIVDLPLAADRDGLVHFDADVRILRPRGAGNGRLLLVVPNRGLLGGVPFSADAPWQLGDLAGMDAGDGFLLVRGWTIAWCGWQWDVQRGPGSLGCAAPAVDVGPGWLRVEFRPDADQPEHRLSDTSALFTFTDYPTADLGDAEAFLTVRLTPEGAPTVVPRKHWRFRDDRTVALDGGFRAFHWYTLTYRTALCPVTGVGLLAMRDASSWLRRQFGYTHAFAYGVSQSGRFLRQFLYEARNRDENGRRVFDGVFAHIAGARRGEFNHRYAQPSLTHPLGFANLPPYDTAGLLDPQRSQGDVPKLFLTNSAFEYWRGDGALVHVDPETGEDLPDDPDARAYLIAGTDHMGTVPLKDLMPGANPVNRVDPGPALRALFVALEQWTCDAVTPPPSQVPREADGTTTTRPEVLQAFAGIPDVYLPDADALTFAHVIDLGPAADDGIGRWPCVLGDAEPAIVSAVDATGNEVAGIRLPAIAVPLRAHTGWNPRRPIPGLPSPVYEFLGSELPLLNDSPGPARESYEHAVRQVAEALVQQRFLLPEDRAAVIADALARYDELYPTHP